IAILGSKPETVVTFLASLELSRLKKMRLYQQDTYQEIYVELLESLQNFNSQLASGFDQVAETVNREAAEHRAAERAAANAAADAAAERDAAAAADALAFLSGTANLAVHGEHAADHEFSGDSAGTGTGTGAGADGDRGGADLGALAAGGNPS